MTLLKHILIGSLAAIALFLVSASPAYAQRYYYGNGSYYAPQYQQQYGGYYTTSSYSPAYSYYVSQPAIYYAVNNPSITYPSTNYQGSYGYNNYTTGYYPTYRQPSPMSCIIGAILTRGGCGGAMNSYYGYGGYYPTQIY
jgi:hypothetical protein